MKITVEPSEALFKNADNFINDPLDMPFKVTLEYSGEPNADAAMSLCARALVAYGFYENNVRACLADDLSLAIFGSPKVQAPSSLK